MIDSHAHVAFEQFDEDRQAVIERARGAGVGWLEVGTDIAQSRAAIVLAEQYDFVWPTVGVHPSDIAELTEQGWHNFELLVGQPSVVAIGEVGLDYYRGGTQQEQLPVLVRMVDIALARDLPLIFHVRSGERDAHEDLLGWLETLPVCPRGVLHTFSGTMEQAKRYLALGLHLSFSGVVTFKNAKAVRAIVAEVPTDRFLIETDCPYLAPMPYRGQRNEPLYVQHVAAAVAHVRGTSVEAIATLTEATARQLFSL